MGRSCAPENLGPHRFFFNDIGIPGSAAMQPPRNDVLGIVQATSDSFGMLATTDWLRPLAFAA
jgi:hypothetical protein